MYEKLDKLRAELEKARQRRAEADAKVKQLEQRLKDAENTQILAEVGANVDKLDHNQFKALDRLRHVALEITVETNGHEHIKEVEKALEAHGYDVEVIY